MVEEEEHELNQNKLLISWSYVIGAIGALIEIVFISIQYLVFTLFASLTVTAVLGVMCYAINVNPNNVIVSTIASLIFLVPIIYVFFINYKAVVAKRLYELNNIPTRINRRFSHKHGLPDDKVTQINDLIDELKIAFDLKAVNLTILKDQSDNLFAIQQGLQIDVFITSHTLLDLNRYELEAVLAVELLSAKVKYKRLQDIHKLCWQPFKEVFYCVLAGDILLFIYGMHQNFSIGVLIIFAIIFIAGLGVLLIGIGFSYLYAQQMQNHLSYLNTQTLHVTNNPEILISAFKKLANTQAAGLKDGHIEDGLWLNPIKANRYHWSLLKQITVLKQF